MQCEGRTSAERELQRLQGVAVACLTFALVCQFVAQYFHPPPSPPACRRLPFLAPRGYFGVLFALGLRRPYWDKRVNYLDCFCCLTILLLILSSLYFNNGSFLDENVLPLSKVFCSIRT
jgi:hypothetical protein